MENNEIENNKKKTFLFVIILLIVLIVCLILYSRYVSTSGLTVIEQSIVDKELPDSFNGFKIAQFADIHYGNTTSMKEIKKMVKKINELNPDILVFTGDLFDEEIKIREEDVTNLKEELAKLDASIQKYAVKGDQDYNYETEFETIFKYANFNILENSNEFIYYKGTTPIKVVGTTSLLKSEIDYTNAFKILGDEEEYFTILFSHEPKIVEQLTDYKVNVILSAHSLGGSISLPFVGGLIKMKGADNYLKGYYETNNIKMYVNSGIGTQTYKFRFFNRPSINLYRLYNY